MTDWQALRDVRESKKHQYEVRTRYLAAKGEPVYINQLIIERSPYLLQHAHNPVNWHRWCDETFRKAKQENKPIFLSVGYSTCHWCHVMEEESFDDEETAALLNQHFIPIKVDREQRPDIDNIYMTAVQLITGRGGWPMSVFLTPEGQPFYGATYFPKPHFMRLLDRIQKLWSDDRDQLYGHATQLTDAITSHLAPPPDIGVIPDELIPGVCQHILGSADKIHGGFGDAPKFPQEAHLLFLLDQLARQPETLTDQPLWKIGKQALDAMLQGGIYDQVAGGFHRYSTDSYWLVPHFEKMLYNQGQLVRVYTQAYQLCKDPEYQRIACETLDYVRKEMCTADGLFCSATDADSEGEEGKFFVWTLEQLKQCLTDDELALTATVWGVKSQGNFAGANVLFLANSLQDSAKTLGISYADLKERLNAVKAKLYAQRQQRIPPLTDTKIITEWNGMIIAAFAEASQIFGRPDYMQTAITAVEQLWAVQRQGDGSLWRISMDGAGSENALLEDYAHLMEALLEIYDGTGQPLFLERCKSLGVLLQDKYWDDSQGGFFISPSTTEGPMLVRSKCLADNATVCGNSQMLMVLNRLCAATGDVRFASIRQQHIAAFAEPISQQPLAALMFLRGLAEVQRANPTYPQYFGGGQIQVRIDQATQVDDRLTLSVCIRLNDGWHIQGPANRGIKNHDADDKTGKRGSTVDGNIEISLLSDQNLTELIYPPTEDLLTQDGAVIPAVYEEVCIILVRMACQSAAPVRLACRLQACYETACMPPEVKEIVYWPAV